MKAKLIDVWRHRGKSGAVGLEVKRSGQKLEIEVTTHCHGSTGGGSGSIRRIRIDPFKDSVVVLDK